MSRLRLPLATVLLCALAACASTPGPAAAPPAPAQASTAAAAAEVEHGAATTAATETLPAHAPPVASSQAADVQPQAEPGIAAESGITTGPVAASAGQAATEAEDDYAALYGPEPAASDDGTAVRPAYDPWEPMNRRIHAFNNVVDRAVAKPLASAYVAVVPQPMRLGVTNFFDNLSSPRTFVNQLLQGRPRHAFQTLGRFVVNSTLGIGGIFDPASDLKMKRRSEDFGQTLGMWGWRSSRYVELPLFGPRTLRDALGLAGDAPLSAVQQVEQDKTRILLQGLQLVDTRAQLAALDSLRESAPDEYAMVRDAWLRRRSFQIESDRRNRAQDSELPDYLREDEERNPTVPADAMPLPIPLPGA